MASSMALSAAGRSSARTRTSPRSPARLVRRTGSAGITGAEAANRQSLFEGLLAVLGTSAFTDTANAIHPGDAVGFAAAYVAGIKFALTAGGLVAVAGGALAWALLGRRDPLTTIYEHRDERVASGTASGTGPA